MSENKMATKEDLKEFYNRIYPYLGGSADAGFTPVGTVISVMSNHAPANYLICDGTVYNISDYPELANHFLNEFGSKNYFGGDGTTTFAVPDLRGEFLRMTGTNSHANQGNGANVGVHQDGTDFPKIGTGKSTEKGVYGNAKSTASSILNQDSSHTQGEIGFTLMNGSSWESSSDVYMTARPTNTSVLYCIATKNIYLNPSNDYSTDEKVVGTWIDGKPIYQKTIVDTLPTIETDGTSVTKHIQLNSSVDKVIKCEGVYQVLSNNFIPFEGSYESGIAGKVYFNRIYVAPNSATNPNNVNKLLITSNQLDISGRPCYITIQYTKTTS